MRSPCVDVQSADWHRLQQSAAFWDVNPTTLDPQRHAAWIIARILQFGTWDEWIALFRCYSAATIQHALAQRGMPDHIRRFWTPYFSPDDSFPEAEPFPSLTTPTPHPLMDQAIQTCDRITHRGTRQDFLDLCALVLWGMSLTTIFERSSCPYRLAISPIFCVTYGLLSIPSQVLNRSYRAHCLNPTLIKLSNRRSGPICFGCSRLARCSGRLVLSPL